MPIRRFWLLHKNVDRLSAEEAIRLMTVMASAQSGESFSSTMTDLRKQMGDVVHMDRVAMSTTEKLDKQGLNALKALQKGKF